MTVKFEDLAAGAVLYDVHRRAGGPVMGTDLGCWRVQVISINAVARSATVSWNGQKPKEWDEARLCALHQAPTEEYLAQKRKKAARVASLHKNHDWSRT